jgi:hypothetical protein
MEDIDGEQCLANGNYNNHNSKVVTLLCDGNSDYHCLVIEHCFHLSDEGLQGGDVVLPGHNV